MRKVPILKIRTLNQLGQHIRHISTRHLTQPLLNQQLRYPFLLLMQYNRIELKLINCLIDSVVEFL